MLINRLFIAGLVLCVGCSSSLQSQGTGGSGGGSGGSGGSLATGGTGGSPVDGGQGLSTTCASLLTQYRQALAAEQACTVVESRGCAAIVSASPLALCDCPSVYVNEATQTNSISETWVSLNCGPISCPSSCIGATPMAPGVCVSTDGGVSGVCQAASPGTGGQDGGSGLPPAACAALVASYQVALAEAQSCGGDAGVQCGSLAMGSLPLYGCPTSCDEVAVNDTTTLNMLHMEWLAAGCQGFGACRTFTCPTTVGMCASADGGPPRCQTIWPL
jgi:hypothetical protein